MAWCQDNSLSLNTSNTKEMIVDPLLAEESATHTVPLHIGGEVVEKVNTFKFLGAHISNDLSWSYNEDNGP